MCAERRFDLLPKRGRWVAGVRYRTLREVDPTYHAGRQPGLPPVNRHVLQVPTAVAAAAAAAAAAATRQRAA